MNNPFIAFYPSKWLARTAKLSAVERGVFITLICEMYEGQIPINFDPKRLARFCGTTPATLKKCVEELLLDEHKMVLVDGALWNNRVEKEIITAQKKSENQSKKSRSRWEKTNEINKPAMPRDNPKSSHLDLEPYNSSLHSELDNSSPSPKPLKNPSIKKSAIPENWEPDQGCIDKAYAVGMDRNTLQVEAENFRNHHFNKQSKMVNWGMAFGTWCNNWKKFSANRKSNVMSAPFGKSAPMKNGDLHQSIIDQLREAGQ